MMHSPADRLYREFQLTGDPAVLGEVYDLVAPELLSIALHLTGHPAEAEDVLQEAAVVALGKLSQYEPGTSFSAWMSQMVRYIALNRKRKLERGPRAELPARAPQPNGIATPCAFRATPVRRFLTAYPAGPRCGPPVSGIL